MKSLKEFINSQLIECDCNGVSTYATHIDESFTFNNYLSKLQQKSHQYEINEDTAWEDYIRLKYSTSSALIHTGILYNTSDARFIEALGNDVYTFNENLKNALDEVSLKFSTEDITVMRTPKDNPSYNVRFYIVVDRKLNNEEFKQLKDIASTNKCFADYDNDMLRNGKIVYVYYIEEDEDNMMQSGNKLVYKENDGILWHLTTKENADNILKNGLEARTERKISTHPPRIYFLACDETTDNIHKYNELLSRFHDDESVLLRIDLNKMKNRPDFFIDTFSSDFKAIFTRTPIPPKCIKKVKLDKSSIKKERIFVCPSRMLSKIYNTAKDIIKFVYRDRKKRY